MKQGDIVHFREESTEVYGNEKFSHEYTLNPDHRYVIETIYEGECCGVRNLEDQTQHFVTNMSLQLMSTEEWREKKLGELGI